ncbi:NAD(P)/FAD-dependent oxidoreductase [Sinorhizobium mexicanum]|uniref:FAD-dependent oxidoreductase n=1 Tax=Sinorhizobium mexicanum TaxID=375549 RepID=A0A859R2R2_9HYPH|nr:NAD(P)/FAD-dependent oxidoreductase [Sinorhizobium mexicanum]MBP1886485.1 NADPH-dependent 2,4-dienoyl-CoA reductase/sulfur reductase-like enzyme [Sinorhizobium mexicanum]QLL63938.1 FAD-dependent oxidoreductase [Sinorhizobium mexicanum]
MTISDLCVIGGGPAGMVAATLAANSGLDVTLLDERPTAGGQIYRGLVGGPFQNSRILGADYSRGTAIIEAFANARLDRRFETSVWRIDAEDDAFAVNFSSKGKSWRKKFKKLILATGAMERSVPFEGWTLPGVMNIGAAQLLLKTSGIVPKGRLILAGNGPLLLLFAAQLSKLDVKPAAILDTAPEVSILQAAVRNCGGLFANFDKVAKGLALIRSLKRSGVPVIRRVTDLKAKGDGRVQSLEFVAEAGARVMNVDHLLVHEGVIPNTQITRALKCRHEWDPVQRCLRPVLDEHGETSLGGAFVIGDAMAINGATAAPASAEIAVARVMEQLGRKTDNGKRIARTRQKLRKEQAFRPFLDAIYQPGLAAASVSDDTIVCRCESVSGADLRQAISDGAVGPSQAKAFTRCGMGACQGRVCGSVVSQVIAEAINRPVGDIDAYSVRFPLKPVPVREIAACKDLDTQEDHHHVA